MKKILAILLALVLVASFAACSKNSNNETPSDAPSTEDNTPVDTNSPAQMIFADFKAKVADEKDVLALAQAVIENENIPFMGGAIEVEEGYLNGFSNEIKGFAKGAQFGPAIGTIPFVGYIFELAEDADVEAFKAMLKENADLRWNICTQADEMLCENEGNLVFFIMAPATFEDEADDGAADADIVVPDADAGAEIPDDADLGISIG